MEGRRPSMSYPPALRLPDESIAGGPGGLGKGPHKTAREPAHAVDLRPLRIGARWIGRTVRTVLYEAAPRCAVGPDVGTVVVQVTRPGRTAAFLVDQHQRARIVDRRAPKERLRGKGV